jgi:hypothetical protein
MPSALLPAAEPGSLRLLQELRVLDTESEKCLDAISRLTQLHPGLLEMEVADAGNDARLAAHHRIPSHS